MIGKVFHTNKLKLLYSQGRDIYTMKIYLEKRIKKLNKNCSDIYQLDVDPQRDDDASPMSTYRCMLRLT